jgi:hypothetical protein
MILPLTWRFPQLSNQLFTPAITERDKLFVIENLTCEQFSQCLGSVFQLRMPSAATLELKLVEVAPYKAHPLPKNRDLSQRDPFSLLFQGLLEIVLPQRIYTLEHAWMGKLDIFLVPIARRQDGMQYEAVFA